MFEFTAGCEYCSPRLTVKTYWHIWCEQFLVSRLRFPCCDGSNSLLWKKANCSQRLAVWAENSLKLRGSRLFWAASPVILHSFPVSSFVSPPSCTCVSVGVASLSFSSAFSPVSSPSPPLQLFPTCSLSASTSTPPYPSCTLLHQLPYTSVF